MRSRRFADEAALRVVEPEAAVSADEPEAALAVVEAEAALAAVEAEETVEVVEETMDSMNGEGVGALKNEPEEDGHDGQLQLCPEDEEKDESSEAADGVRDSGRRRRPRTLRGMVSAEIHSEIWVERVFSSERCSRFRVAGVVESRRVVQS